MSDAQNRIEGIHMAWTECMAENETLRTRLDEAVRLLRMMTDALAPEFGHDQMMNDEPPDDIDLAYRAVMAYFDSSAAALNKEAPDGC